MKKGYLCIVLATFFFSTMEIALKISAGHYNAIQLTFLRFLIGALVLLPLSLREIKRRKSVFSANDFLFFLLTGFICVVVSMILFQMGIIYSQANVSAVLFSCNSVFVILFAHFMLEEKVYKHTVLSVIVSMLGMLIIANPLHLQGSGIGIALSLGAAITFALYNVVGRTRSEAYGGITLTCMSFFSGCVQMLLLIGLSHIPPLAAGLKGAGLKVFSNIPLISGISLSSLPGLLYVGIFVTGLGYTFYFLAMEQTGAATASLVFYIKPVLAPVFALLILGEPITGQMVYGIVLILVGSVLSFVPGLMMRKSTCEIQTADESRED